MIKLIKKLIKLIKSSLEKKFVINSMSFFLYIKNPDLLYTIYSSIILNILLSCFKKIIKYN